jgi:hypothetical protein
MDFVRQKVVMSTTQKYVMWHIVPTQNTTWHSVLLTVCEILVKRVIVCTWIMVLQSKDLQPFMGLQNKGGRHSDVQQKKPKQVFSGELKKGKKISCQWDHLLAIQWKDIPDVFLTTVHKDVRGPTIK